MDRETFEDYVARFEATGLKYAMQERDGSGNVNGLRVLDWNAALIHIMRQTGWVLMPAQEAEPEVTPRQYGHLVRLK